MDIWMKIIDAHMHADFHMTGYADYGREIGVEFSLEGMRKELAQNNVRFAVSIGADMYTPTPMSLKPLKRAAEADSRIVPVAGINPQTCQALQWGTYIDLIKKAVPAKHHRLVFHDNAERLFRLK